MMHFKSSSSHYLYSFRLTFLFFLFRHSHLFNEELTYLDQQKSMDSMIDIITMASKAPVSSILDSSYSVRNFLFWEILTKTLDLYILTILDAL